MSAAQPKISILEPYGDFRLALGPLSRPLSVKAGALLVDDAGARTKGIPAKTAKNAHGTEERHGCTEQDLEQIDEFRRGGKAGEDAGTGWERKQSEKICCRCRPTAGYVTAKLKVHCALISAASGCAQSRYASKLSPWQHSGQ